jgi:TrkA domain protein
MSVDLRETRLPGVGVKYAFRTHQGGRVSVIMHNDGLREIYFYRRGDDDEPTAVIELHDDEARQLGAIIGGAYERPKIVEELEMALGELQIEWIPVPDSSPAIGLTLAAAGLRARTGVTVIAILREPESVSGARPEDVIKQGDTLVGVGKAGQFAQFRRMLAEGPFEEA